MCIMSIIATANNKSCEITALFIPKSERGKGLGSKELQRLEQVLRDHGCTTATAYVSGWSWDSEDWNPPSEFYRKNGYQHKYPNFGNWMTQTFGYPKNGQPQSGPMYKPL